MDDTAFTQDNGFVLGARIAKIICFGVISSTAFDNTGGKMAKVVPASCFVNLVNECSKNPKVAELSENFRSRIHIKW